MTGSAWRSSALIALLCILCTGTRAYAQSATILARAEKAFCDGDDIGAERTMRQLLSDPRSPRANRFEAYLLLAEIHYLRSAQEQFLAVTDSAALLLGPMDGTEQEAWARVEVNRSRYAFTAMQYARAMDQAGSAMRRWRVAPDRSHWKEAFRIHEALATAHRMKPGSFDPNGPEGVAIGSAHFDTALTLIKAQHTLPRYWEAELHRRIGNAAMDQMHPENRLRERYMVICGEAQSRALAILQQHHPRNILQRANVMNLHGLYLSYCDRPKEALDWFSQTQHLLAPSVWQEHDRRFYLTWVTSVHWMRYAMIREPWWSDTTALKEHLVRLRAAAPLYAAHASEQTTAKGLFTHDGYDHSLLSSTAAVGRRLWELTGRMHHVEVVLHAIETARRDAWNVAQVLRGRPEIVLEPAPTNMLSALRQHMSDNEAFLIVFHYGIAHWGQRVATLCITPEAVSFNECVFNTEWYQLLDNPWELKPQRERRILYDIQKAIYAPVRTLLQDRAERIRVVSFGELGKLSFDGLIADTSSQDIRRCHPLVQDHAISHPYFLLPPIARAEPTNGKATLYLAPTPHTGELTDLSTLRTAMAQWSGGALPGPIDSSTTDRTKALDLIGNTDLLIWGGHCGGDVFQHHEPIAYLSGDRGDAAATLRPSHLFRRSNTPPFVIHAACQGGVFQAIGSTGVFSFARAFLFGGSHTVIAAQRSADERASADLIEPLLDRLSKGVPADLALQQAKLAYLEQATTHEAARPRYWATWQVWGEPSVITAPTQHWKWPWVLLGILLAAPLYGWWMVRRRKS